MSVWLVYESVNYEGTDEDTIRCFLTYEKAKEICDEMNKTRSKFSYWYIQEVIVE